MKLLITLFMSLLFTFSSFANSGEEIGLKLKSINLEGMKITEVKTQLNVFKEELLYTKYITLGDLRAMANAYNFGIVSRFFASIQSPPLENIYAVVGNVNDQYQLITYFVKDHSATAIVYDIKKVENDKLVVENGPEGEERIYEVTATQLFPAI